MNDLPKVINNRSIPVLLASDTSIFSHSNFKGFEENVNTVFETLNNWFERNLPSLKFEETYHTCFVTKNNTPIYMQICYHNKTVPNITCTEFIGLIIDNNLTRKIILNCSLIDLVQPVMLYDQSYTSTYTNNYILCPFSFGYDIWHHILRQFNP